METLTNQLPSLEELTAGLALALRGPRLSLGRPAILHRELSPYSTSFPCEIVTCRLHDGTELRLFCKYATGHHENAHGYRGGVGYEVKVYRHVLRPSNASAPRFYGTYEDPITRETWLLIEYLDNTFRVGKEPTAIGLAAEWIARFHTANERRVSSVVKRFLSQYGSKYYVGWAKRTLLFSMPLCPRFPWLATLCRRFKAVLPILLAPPRTIIHGEYYPHNILFRSGIIYPVDWESAAIAAGEIDLAALIEGWPQKIVEDCELRYQRTRWPKGVPAGFQQRLFAARLYLQLRWLGDRPEWTADKNSQWRFEYLRSAGERLGLI